MISGDADGRCSLLHQIPPFPSVVGLEELSCLAGLAVERGVSLRMCLPQCTCAFLTARNLIRKKNLDGDRWGWQHKEINPVLG